jgi:SSS family solute:Na+ symporter
MSTSFFVALILYIIAATLIAVYARRGIKSQEDYFIGGRNIGGFVSALTYAATTYSAFMMVGLVGFAYSTGIGSAGFELMYLVGTLFLLSYYAPKIWGLSRDKGFVTPSEIFAERYGLLVTKLIAIIALIALIPYTSAQMIGVALILEKNIQISFQTGVLFTAFLIAIWALLGGLRGVAWTDALQGLVMLLSAILVVVWIYFWGFGLDSSSFMENLSSAKGVLEFPNSFWTPLRFAGFVVPWFFFSLTNPQVFQRLFIPRNSRSLRKMILLFAIFGFIYTVLTTFMGLELRALTEGGVFPEVQDRDSVTPTAIQFMPEWLALLISLSIIAAAVTTSNSIILTLSSMASRDISRKASVLAGEITVVVMTVLVALVALRKPDYIVALSVLSSTILLCQLPLILGIFHGKKGKEMTGILTLLSGFTIAIASIFGLSLPFLPVSIWVFVVSFGVYLVFSRVES